MQANRRKTHCPQGHPYDVDNTAMYKGRRYCRDCHRVYGRNWARKRRAEDREAVNAAQQAWRDGNPMKIEEYRKLNRVYMREYRFLKEYGLTLAQRASLFEESDGLCAICYSVPAEAVDHDHRTGAVRGAVCHRCNWGLSNFKEDPDILRAAIEYLQVPRVAEDSA